ncbi:MAG: protein BatD [Rhodobacteraceae bacterium]|nr:MAG: protein BatD [Paracoccaceae bacterium]
MNRHRLAGLALVALMAGASAGFADGLTARISTDRLALGETFQLTLSADPADLTAAPDISALNADFDILGTSKSTQTRIVNGRRSALESWIITLAPRATGHLTIPALGAEQATSAAINVEVVDPADLPPVERAQGAAITLTAEPGTHYEQQEIPLTLRITTSDALRNGAITEPSSPNYVLERRGEDRISRMTQAGTPVTVIERDYLLRPQKSGTLRVAPFTLRGSISDPDARRSDPFADFFGRSPFGGAGSPFGSMLNPGRPVTLRTAPLTLEIKARPTAATDWFLPAKAVSLTAEWQPAQPEFRVGEAVTRHVRIEALGATEVQLPDIALPEVAGARVYSEGSQAGSIDTPDGTAAVRDFTFSVVPTSGGTLTLPEIRVTWFDTATEQARSALLPAETIQVAGPVASATAAPPAATPALSASEVSPQSAPVPRRMLAAIAAFAALLAGVGVYLWRKGITSKTPPAPLTQASRRQAELRRVETACAARDAAAAYAAALGWLRAASRDTGQTGEAILSDHLDLSARLSALERHSYAGSADRQWDAPALLRALRAADRTLKSRARKGRGPVLPPLYPARAGVA